MIILANISCIISIHLTEHINLLNKMNYKTIHKVQNIVNKLP